MRTKDTISFSKPTTPSPQDEEEYDSGEDDEYAEEEEYPEMEREGGLVAKSSTIAEDDDEVEELPETPAASTTPFSIIKNYKLSTSTARSTTFEQGSSTTQKQVATIPSVRDKYRVVQKQNGRTQIHSSQSSTEKSDIKPKKIPALAQKHETKEVVRTKFLPTKDGGNVDKKQLPDSYVSITKQITGVEENKNNLPSIPGKNFESTYYTKSSTCGYFTFSCNIVYGANGRSKICRPKPPTNGKC